MSLWDSIRNFVVKDDKANWGNILPAVASAYGLARLSQSGFANSDSQPVGYQGGIPKYIAERGAVPNTPAPRTTRRPGSSGQRYFTDVKYTRDANMPIMGKTADQLAAENAAAAARQKEFEDMFSTLLGSVGSGNTPAPTTPTTPPAAPKMTIGPSNMTRSGFNTYATDAMTNTPTKFVVDGKTYSDDRSVDSGEASTLLSAAQTLGLSPSEVAKSLGVTTDQVVNRIKADYPTLGADYLKTHGFASGGLASLGRRGPNRFRGRTPPPAQAPVAGLPGVMEMLRARSSSPSGVGFSTPMPASSMRMADDLQHLQVSPQEMEYKKQVMQSGAYPFSSTGKLGTAPGMGVPASASNWISGSSPAPAGVPPGAFMPNTRQMDNFDALNPSSLSVMGGAVNTGRGVPASASSWTSGSVMGPASPPPPGMRVPNAQGGLGMFAQGGLASLRAPRGYYLGGATDGMADKIPARIDGKQEARLSDGEFVIPADVVGHLGNGNSEAGAQVLYKMMDRVRQARTGSKEQGRQINPNKYTPV